MAIRNEAFLSIDEGLQNQLTQEWDQAATRIADTLLRAFEAGDRGRMLAIAQEVSMETFARKMRKKLKSFGTAAAIFGAKTLSGDEPTSLTKARKANEPPFDSIQKAVSASTQASEEIMASAGTQALRDNLTATISQTPVDLEDLSDVARVQFKNKVLSQTVGTGRGYSQLAGGLHSSRLSVWGFTQEARVRQLTHYTVNEVLDSRTCPICQTMHGKTFAVESASRLIEEVLTVDDPDQFKQQFPWPDQSKAGVQQFREMNSEQLEANKWITPPFHPGCRGILRAATFSEIANVTVSPQGVLEPSVGPSGIITTQHSPTVSQVGDFLKTIPSPIPGQHLPLLHLATEESRKVFRKKLTEDSGLLGFSVKDKFFNDAAFDIVDINDLVGISGTMSDAAVKAKYSNLAKFVNDDVGHLNKPVAVVYKKNGKFIVLDKRDQETIEAHILYGRDKLTVRVLTDDDFGEMPDVDVVGPQAAAQLPQGKPGVDPVDNEPDLPPPPPKAPDRSLDVGPDTEVDGLADVDVVEQAVKTFSFKQTSLDNSADDARASLEKAIKFGVISNEEGLPIALAESYELMALREYTKEMFEQTNAGLRIGRLPPLLERYADVLSGAIKKLPVYQGTVYRGIRVGRQDLTAFMEKYAEGNVVTAKHFVSASRDESAVFKHNVNFVIKSQRGARIEVVSAYSQEREILFDKGSRFEVLKVSGDPDSGPLTVYLEEV